MLAVRVVLATKLFRQGSEEQSSYAASDWIVDFWNLVEQVGIGWNRLRSLEVARQTLVKGVEGALPLVAW